MPPQGGGFCVSAGLTSYGVTAMNASVRGESFHPDEVCQVLSMGLFDGLGGRL